MKKDYLNCKMRLNRSHKHNLKKKPNPCTECVYFQLTLTGTVSPEQALHKNINSGKRISKWPINTGKGDQLE